MTNAEIITTEISEDIITGRKTDADSGVIKFVFLKFELVIFLQYQYFLVNLDGSAIQMNLIHKVDSH